MFLECTDDNFLLQMIKDPKRRDTELDFILTNRESLKRNVNLKSSVSYSSREMVESKILRALRKAHSKPTETPAPQKKTIVFWDASKLWSSGQGRSFSYFVCSCEFSSGVLCSAPVCQHKKYLDLIEQVQRRAMKMVTGMEPCETTPMKTG